MSDLNYEWNVTYDSEIISQDTLIDPKGCNCISIEAINIVAEQIAIIDNNIPLFYGMGRMFNNLAGQQIESKLKVKLLGAYQILIVRTYYTKKD